MISKVIAQFSSHIFGKDMELDEVHQIMGNLRATIVSDTLPMLQAMEVSLKTAVVPQKNRPAIDKVLDALGEKTLDKAISKLHANTKEFLNALTEMDKYISKTFKGYVLEETMTAKQAGSLYLISNFASVLLATDDIAMYIVYKLTDSELIYKTKELQTIDMLYSYKATVNRYSGKTQEAIKEVIMLSDVLVKDDASFSQNATQNDLKLSLMPNQFSGNPLFYLRLRYVDYQIKKIEKLKISRNLVNTKLLELSMKKETTPVIEQQKLEKTIKYNEERLVKIEKEIANLEEV